MTAADEADIVVAADEKRGCKGIYALHSCAHPDAFHFAIVLDPYSASNLVLTHYALVAATGGRRVAGRVMYVNGAAHEPRPMWHARKLVLSPAEREAAKARVAARRAAWEASPDRLEVEADARRFFDAIRAHDADLFAEFEKEMDRPASGPPYRGAITIDFEKGILGIVADPFPSTPQPRILVVAEDDDTARRLRADFEVIHVDEGWAAIEHVEKTDFDVILCALRVGTMSGASIYRMIATAKPELAARVAFVASAKTAAAAPPSSATARVLARPVTVEQVRSLVGTDAPGRP